MPNPNQTDPISPRRLTRAELDAMIPPGRWVSIAEPTQEGPMDFATVDREELLAAVDEARTIAWLSGPEATARGFGAMLIMVGSTGPETVYIATSRNADIPALLQIAVPLAHRTEWRKAAKAAGMTLEQWAEQQLNRAADDLGEKAGGK